LIQEKVRQVNEFVENNFKGTLLENYQRFCKFKVPIENKLSVLFGKLESIQQNMGIENYSLR
jgi:hypothetical protein